MKISLPYGKTHLSLELPDHLSVDVLHPRQTPPAPDPAAEVAAALDNVDWLQFKGARSAAIAVNDKTRPVPHDLLLPP